MLGHEEDSRINSSRQESDRRNSVESPLQELSSPTSRATGKHVPVAAHSSRVLALVGCVLTITVVTVIAMIWETTYNWPDFVHANYGFPFVWGTHTLSSFAGPVDEWSVDISMLTYDLSLWLGALVLVVTIVASYFQKLTNREMRARHGN